MERKKYKKEGYISDECLREDHSECTRSICTCFCHDTEEDDLEDDNQEEDDWIF